MPAMPAEKVIKVPLRLVDEKSIFQLRLRPTPRRVLESMRALGQLYPVHLQSKGQRYRVIDGEQRIQAARALEWEEIAAVVHDVEDLEAAKLAYQLNDEHEPFTPLERLNAIEALSERGLTNAQIAPIVRLKHEKSIARLRGQLPISRKHWALLREGRVLPGQLDVIRRAPKKKWDRYMRGRPGTAG